MKTMLLSILKKLFLFVLILSLIFGAILLISNGFVVFTIAKNIITIEEAKDKNADCILVLGAAVIGTQKPSPILADRLQKSVEVYAAGASPRILMSGEHIDRYYNEVLVMKKYAVAKGVPSSVIFLDHAGLSTYDSLYRAKAVFGVQNVVIVTQQYHLYRALYIARQLGIEAYGVPADHKNYPGNLRRELREIFARTKDFFACIIKMEPRSLGPAISLKGSGDDTN